MDKICGIYKITNTVNNKVYIGSSIDISRRWKVHRASLSDNKGKVNEYLRREWKKYGEDSFEFEIIEKCSKHILHYREQHWMDFYKSRNRKYGYNLMPAFPRHKAEYGKLLSKLLKGRKVSEHTRKKISHGIKKYYETNKITRSVKTKTKISVSKTGDKNPKSKLSKEQVLEIFNSEKSIDELSQAYSVSHSTIRRIKKKDHWVFNI